MKTPNLLILVVVLSSIAGLYAASGSETEVLQSEQARIAALVRDDYPALERLLSDDLSYTHSTAAVDTKPRYLESLRSGRLKYKSLDHEQQQVRLYGDTAVLTGLSKVCSIVEGQEVRLTLRFTIVYVKKSGRWQMVAWQSTRVP
jgi:hypothetical protein